jgi:PAS domain S-box-containing protein
MRSHDAYDPWVLDVPSDALLRAVVEASDDAVLTYDAAGNLTSWSRTAERFFGYAPAEIIGQPFVMLFLGHEQDAVTAVVDAVSTGDPVTRFETIARRKGDMSMPVSISVQPVFDERESLVAALVVVRDVAEQRLAQAALAEVESRIRDSEAMAQMGSWLWDVGTGAVQWSDECHRIHGVDPLDFLGTLASHIEVIHADDRDRVRAGMNGAVDSARAFDDHYRVARPDGTVRSIHARARPAIAANGAVLALRGIVQDVTNRQR